MTYRIIAFLLSALLFAMVAFILALPSEGVETQVYSVFNTKTSTVGIAPFGGTEEGIGRTDESLGDGGSATIAAIEGLAVKTIGNCPDPNYYGADEFEELMAIELSQRGIVGPRMLHKFGLGEAGIFMSYLPPLPDPAKHLNFVEVRTYDIGMREGVFLVFITDDGCARLTAQQPSSQYWVIISEMGLV